MFSTFLNTKFFIPFLFCGALLFLLQGCSSTLAVVDSEARPVEGVLVISHSESIFTSPSESAFITGADGLIEGVDTKGLFIVKAGYYPVFSTYSDGFCRQMAYLWRLQDPGNIALSRYEFSWSRNRYDILGTWHRVEAQLPFDIAIYAKVRDDDFASDAKGCKRRLRQQDFFDSLPESIDYRIEALSGSLSRADAFYWEEEAVIMTSVNELILERGGSFFVLDDAGNVIGKVRLGDGIEATENVPSYIFRIDSVMWYAKLNGKALMLQPDINWRAIHKWSSALDGEIFKGPAKEMEARRLIDDFLLSLMPYIDVDKCSRRVRQGVYYPHLEEKAIYERIVDIKSERERGEK